MEKDFEVYLTPYEIFGLRMKLNSFMDKRYVLEQKPTKYPKGVPYSLIASDF
jgi:hypothetical protein